MICRHLEFLLFILRIFFLSSHLRKKTSRIVYSICLINISTNVFISWTIPYIVTRQEVPIVVAGNKLDLATTRREVPIEDVSEWLYCELPKLRAKIMECSAKDDYNVKDIFRCFITLSKIVPKNHVGESDESGLRRRCSAYGSRRYNSFALSVPFFLLFTFFSFSLSFFFFFFCISPFLHRIFLRCIDQFFNTHVVWEISFTCIIHRFTISFNYK